MGATSPATGSGPQRRGHGALAGQGLVAEARAQGVRDGVADRRDSRPAARLAYAERRPVGGGIDQLDRDFRHLAEAQDRVAFPVTRADAVFVEPHTLLQGPAGALDDAAFQLIDRA